MAPTRHSSSSSGHEGIHALEQTPALEFRSLKDQGFSPPTTPRNSRQSFLPLGTTPSSQTVRTPCSSRPPAPSNGCAYQSRTIQSLRHHPRPIGRFLSFGTGRQCGPRPPSVRTGDDGVGHHLADAQRLARSPRLLGDWSVYRTGERSPLQRRTRVTSMRATCSCERPGVCTAASTSSSTVNLRSTTAGSTPSGSTAATPTTVWRRRTLSSTTSP